MNRFERNTVHLTPKSLQKCKAMRALSKILNLEGALFLSLLW